MLTAIVGILLGNLLIATLFAPALQRLREILRSFANIQLFHRIPFGERLSFNRVREIQKKAASDFNRLFRE
jgi:hypothetical protein